MTSSGNLVAVTSCPPMALERLRAGLDLASQESLGDQVQRFLAFRGTLLGECVELQTIPGPEAKYPAHLRTADPNVVVQALSDLPPSIMGVFYVQNQITPDILAHGAMSAFVPMKKNEGTTNAHILTRRVLYIDFDPDRPSGISSTTEEQALARTAAEACFLSIVDFVGGDLMSAIGFGCSGNGAHVYLALDDLPNDEATTRLVRGLLLGASHMFAVPSVKVDQSVHDPKRLCPAFGTYKRKGPNTETRPHRRTYFWSEEGGSRLCLDMLQGLAEHWRDLAPAGEPRKRIDDVLHPAPPKTKGAGTRRGDASLTPRSHTDSIFDRVNDLPVREVANKLGLTPNGQLTCPGCHETSGFGFYENGVKCFHDRCTSKGLSGFRTNVDLATEVHGCSPLEAAQHLAQAFGLDMNSAYSAYSAAPPDEWTPPDPLVAKRVPAVFPVGALPSWLADWVTAEAEETQTPPDLAAMVGLTAAAACVTKKYELHVNSEVQRGRGGWREPLCLYAVAILPSGGRKSAVFSHGLYPLRDYEADAWRKAQPERKKVALLQKAFEKKHNNFVASLSAKEGGTLAFQQLEAFLADNAPPEMPPSPRFVVDDTTPEALSQTLSEQGGRAALFAPEGGLLNILTGAYANQVNIDVFLKSHGGEDITVSRVTRASLHIPHATMTIGLTVQPIVLSKLIYTDELRGRGLPARFLYFMPNDTLGQRRANAPQMPPVIRDRYEHELRRLLDITPKTNEDGWFVPTAMYLSPEALARLQEFTEVHEKRLGEDGDLVHLSDWASKLPGALARIAALFHLMEGDPSTPVPTLQVERAITLGDYLMEHARAAFDGNERSTDANSKARRILNWIQKTSATEFSQRDVFNALRSGFKEAHNLEEPLRLLVDHKYIRPVTASRSPRGRPPSTRYEVNPLTHPHNTHNTQ